MTGIAILGAGRIGQVHANAISSCPDAELVAIADPAAIAARAVAARHQCKISSIGDIAQDDDVDAVAICTPTDTHADLIEQFANAGKAIFCEKPIDLSVERVRRCLDVVERTGAKLMVGFNRRFDPAFAAAKAKVVGGDVGEVELVQITSRDPSPPPAGYIRSSGGIFRDMTIHDFDMARFLLGEEPESVSAFASVLTDPGIGDLGDFDTVSVLLMTAGGKQATITNSRRATYGYDQRAEVHGSQGMVAVDNPLPATIRSANSNGFSTPPLHDFFMTRYAQAYSREIAAFVAMVNENEPMSPSGEDGLRALVLAEAADLSVGENRRVAISEISDRLLDA